MGRLEALGLEKFLPIFTTVAVSMVTLFCSLFHSDPASILMAFLPYQSFLLAVSVKRSVIKCKSETYRAFPTTEESLLRIGMK